MSSKFCGECGSQLLPEVKFCSECGEPVPFSPPAHLPSGPPPTYPPAAVTLEILGDEPRPARQPRNRVVLAAVVLVCGVIVAVVVLRDRDDGGLPEAVTSKPRLAWTHVASGPLAAVLGVGDDEVVTLTEGGELASLDADGDARWTTDVEAFDDANGVYVEEDFDVVYVFAYGEDAPQTAAFSREGEPRWDTDGGPVLVEDDRILVATDDTLRRLDPESGDEEWSVDLDGAAAVGEEVAAVVRDGSLHGIDADSGEELWSAELQGSVDPEDYPRLTMSESFVVFNNDADGAEAFDLESGEPLWTADPGPDGTFVGNAGRGRVFVMESDYGTDEADQALVRILDEDGEADAFRATSYFLRAYEDGEEVYFVDSDGRIYDGEYDQVGATHDGDVQVVEGGLYEMSDSAIAYFGFEDTEPTWTLEGDFQGTEDDPLYLLASDGRVLVLDGDELRAYS